jgi:protein phosphatase
MEESYRRGVNSVVLHWKAMAWGKQNAHTAAERGTTTRRGSARGRNAVKMRDAHGPFDIVGDVHGCIEELLQLLNALGYSIREGSAECPVIAPRGRMLAFVGDLVDRGPAAPAVLRLAMTMTRSGTALCIAGNRDMELARVMRGRPAKVTRGMKLTLKQLGKQPEEFRSDVTNFLGGLPSHLLLDDGRLVIAHAGLKEDLQGRTSAVARAFALHGEVTGETDASGLPVRVNWAKDYRGKALVVHGHTPVAEPLWLNNTVNIDTGCVYGGHLTALRYPERETFSIPARAIYYPPRKPFPANGMLTAKPE